jgi:putative membrane protein
MKVTVLIGGVALALAAAPAFAQSAAPAAAPSFASTASVSNTFEVEEGKLALKQATSPKVKAFARMMIADHTKAEKKLQAAAKASGAPVEMTLDDPHQAMVTALQGKTGADFDKAYIADQVQAHQEAATLLGDYGKSGDDPRLKSWAKATLPAVNKHLKKAQTLSSM